MPLLVPGMNYDQWEAWPDDLRCSSDAELFKAVEGCPSLIESSYKLPKSETVQVPSSGSRVLFVREGEIALNVNPEFHDYIGSDDATTCHIVLVINPSNNEISVAHIDSQKRCQGVKEILNYLAGDSCGILDIHILGGLLDCRLSLTITDRLIREMCESSAVCRLHTLCTQRFNADTTRSTQGRPFPLVYGIGRGGDGRVTAMRFPPAARGPNYLARRCASYHPSTCLVIMYDGRHNSRFRIKRLADGALADSHDFFRSLYRMDDPLAFLYVTSTSPHCEPAHFCAEFREMLETCCDEEALRSCFIGRRGEPIDVLEYQQAPSGAWTLVA